MANGKRKEALKPFYTWKYFPINVDTIDQDCDKAFVNVFASSIEEPDALICCNSDYISGICKPPPSYLLFSRRLTRFPDAWLLPLFPLLLRIVLQIVRGSDGIANNDFNTKRRLYLYIFLIQFRGWILYLLFGAIEEMLVSSPGEACWYGDLLENHFSKCQGRATDFSDHTVLYFAQILPIALTEVLHSFSTPLCHGKDDNKNDDPLQKAVPVVLLLWLANLYAITCCSAYKTALYFHTGTELFVGYLISLLIQIPLCLTQCTSMFPRVRAYFFGFTQYDTD
eukprot:scaffold672_cov126-Cylindrotheca_fusiformis.AAC.18